jgi:hypothetical protein
MACASIPDPLAIYPTECGMTRRGRGVVQRPDGVTSYSTADRLQLGGGAYMLHSRT